MFTDVEGSTRLVRELGSSEWALLLERHRTIVRSALAAGGGNEILTEGDSFFAVFESAPAAVGAATQIQLQLSEANWPEGAEVLVRIGLHTGDGILDADASYVGADVHRAARISAAAHGGQVLLSETTTALATNKLPKGVTLVGLGRHRLKDLSAETLCQLRIDGLRGEFPPLRGADQSPNNLPTQLTSFVGRDVEIAKATQLLDRNRLLTLTGPGGTGKTRLSLHLAALQADAFPAGRWFVGLEPIRDPELVAPTIARTIGVEFSGHRTAFQQVADWIGEKRLLLLLDNFEQVVGAASVVSDLLRSCPNLKIVCTSRAVLRVSGEQEYEVPGLPSPPDLSRMSRLELGNLPESALHPGAETLNQYEAVRLFIARALAVKPGFAVTNENAPAVAQICAHLHGMPLAIELAAARIKLLSPQGILDRLEHKLALLISASRDLPKRQQTLRGAIEWSFELLDPSQQMLASRLSVFSGGWDLVAADAVAAAGISGEGVLDELAALVDQSLVRQDESDGAIRFEMFPTIREFMTETLTKQGGATEVFDRHAAFFLQLAEEAAPLLHGEEQRSWMDRLEREHDNMRAAVDWATAKPDPKTAVRLVFALWRFWQRRGYLREARKRLDAIIARKWQLQDAARGRLLEAAGGIAYWQADNSSASRYYNEALEAWRLVGDRKEIANAIYNYSLTDLVPVLRGKELLDGQMAASSTAACQEALAIFRELGDRVGEGNIKWALGGFALFDGKFMQAHEWFEGARTIFVEVGHRTMEAWALYMSQLSLVELGDVDAAVRSARQALLLFHDAGDLSGVAMSLRGLSALAVMQHDNDRAGRLNGATRKLLVSTGAELAGQLERTFAGYDPEAHLGSQELEGLGREGSTMSLDQVVSYALGTDATA